MEPRFFISYARADAIYASRLGELLKSESLPFWHDEHLDWGSSFTEEICRRIHSALAVIVLMSPAARESDWVEREILEAQSCDRQLLPILLDGERLFLLAASHYVDARGGQLPGRRELDQLRRMAGHAARTGRATDEPRIEPSNPPERAPMSRSGPTESLDPALLERLRHHLARGDLAHADILTTSLLLGAVGRLDMGWMRQRDADLLGSDDLRAVDDAWSDGTGRRQGFSAQLVRRGDARGVRPLSGWRDFSELASVLGWKDASTAVTPRYDAFTPEGKEPPGFFPTLRNPQLERHLGWHDRWVITALAVHTRLDRWRGRK